MASPSSLTSKAKGMDFVCVYTCMCVRVTNFVQKKESTCRKVGESVSSSERASVEKSRRIERTE